MPAIGPVLGALIITSVSQRMKSILGSGPLDQKNPSYYIKFCMGIGKGIADSSPTIPYTTNDKGTYVIPPGGGAGAGVGIIVDADYMSEQMYTLARNSVLSKFGKTLHAAWPPPADNLSGRFLRSLTDGICYAIKDHYKIAWILASAHPNITTGTGKVPFGGFSGLTAEKTKGAIMAAFGGGLSGPATGGMVNAFAKGYVDGILNKSTATVLIGGGGGGATTGVGSGAAV